MTSCYDGEAGASGEILADVKQLLPDLPESVIQSHLNRTIADFARKSYVWRYYDHLAKMCDGANSYKVPVEGVQVVKVDEIYTRPCCGPECEQKLPHGREKHAKCTCCPDQHWIEQVPGTIVFNREWNKSCELRFSLILAPEKGTDTFPPELLCEYQDTIQAGLLARLYQIPENRDIDMMAYNSGLYRGAIQKAKGLYRNNMTIGRPTYKHGSEYGGGSCC